MARPAALLALALLAAPLVARAQDDGAYPEDLGELTVIHGPLQPPVEKRVRDFVLQVASNFSGFYPDAHYRNVRAVVFQSGSIIVCGEIDKETGEGARSGWHYFTNSGPLIYEAEGMEENCERRTYTQQGFADEHEYGPDFTEAAANTQVVTQRASKISN